MEEILEVGAKLRGEIGAECWRPYDPLNAHFIKEKFGHDSPEYKAIPRYLAWKEQVHNVVTDEGLDAILDIMFHASTQITTWYCLIFESNTTPDGNTTYATPVFTESTAYDESTRPEYQEAAASSQSITNSANKAEFTMNATKTIYGAALVGGGTSPNGKGDTTSGGTLYAASQFGSSRAVQDDDVLKLTYIVGAADDAA